MLMDVEKDMDICFMIRDKHGRVGSVVNRLLCGRFLRSDFARRLG